RPPRTPSRSPAERGAGMSTESREVMERLHAAFSDDLDTPKALAVLWDLVKSSTAPEEQSAIIAYADQVLGLGLTTFLGKKVRVPAEVRRLAAEREDARVRKDWARADVLRAQLEALGWIVEDTKAGPVARPRHQASGVSDQRTS
ncbi:MAG: hypothetical protein Q7S02_04805, partial [bacterium]|nr:hypothetical protein [bacterium]